MAQVSPDLAGEGTAIIQLAGEGWPWRAGLCHAGGPRPSGTVRTYTRDEVQQIYDVREMLTRQAALMMQLPAPEALIQQLRALRAVYRERAAAQDLCGVHDANDAFHIALFEACGNPYLVHTLQDYMDLTLPGR
jgi:DNA-binding GntR family transcriptional regulator